MIKVNIPKSMPAVLQVVQNVWSKLVDILLVPFMGPTANMKGIRINDEVARRAKADLDAKETQVKRLTYGVALRAVEFLKQTTPAATGKTASGWNIRVENRELGHVTYHITHPDIAMINRLNFGTRAHVIRAKGKALHFFVGSKEIFVKQVNHPGTAGLGFLTKVTAQMEADLKAVNVTP